VIAVAHGWPAEAWAALAAWATVALALIAGTIALRQLFETRRIRLEQAQPYVVIFMEPSAADVRIIDLVVRNFGTTAATDVRVEITPRLKRSGSEEEVWLPDHIPVLVPGQEWRTLWDSALQRVQTDLPSRYNAEVIFKDSQGQQSFQFPCVLDWGPYKGRVWVPVYGGHHAARALLEISGAIAEWREGGQGALAVFVRDGDAKDRRTQEWFDSQQAPPEPAESNEDTR
jgi:hypothetical protein